MSLSAQVSSLTNMYELVSVRASGYGWGLCVQFKLGVGPAATANPGDMSEGERSPMGSQAVNQDVLRKSLCVPQPSLQCVARRSRHATPRWVMLTVWCRRAPAAASPRRRATARAPRGRLGKEEDAPDTRGSDEGGSISIAQILSLKERFDRAGRCMIMDVPPHTHTHTYTHTHTHTHTHISDTDGGGSLDLQEFMSAFGSILNKDGSKTGLHDRYCFCAPPHPTLLPIPATATVVSDNSVRSLIQMSRLSASLCRSTPTPMAASTGKTPTRR